MNIDKLREELAADEGCKFEIYLDHLGYKTYGIGHLITEDEAEYGYPVGVPVGEGRVIEAFETDIAITIADCDILFDDFATLPEEAQLILANMMFNMGLPRMSKFKNMIAAVEAGDWNEAAVQMQDSKWYNQVTNRAERLIERMRNVTNA
jgi:lysozyme